MLKAAYSIAHADSRDTCFESHTHSWTKFLEWELREWDALLNQYFTTTPWASCWSQKRNELSHYIFKSQKTMRELQQSKNYLMWDLLQHFERSLWWISIQPEWHPPTREPTSPFIWSVHNLQHHGILYVSDHHCTHHAWNPFQTNGC